MEPSLRSVMPPCGIGPPSPRAVNDQTVFLADPDEFALCVTIDEAFLRGSVEPGPFSRGSSYECLTAHRTATAEGSEIADAAFEKNADPMWSCRNGVQVRYPLERSGEAISVVANASRSFMGAPNNEAVFSIPLPGGRVARVPLQMLEQHIDPQARIAHGAEADDDVTAHSMSVDPTTGASVWHTDWELGQCEYTDDNGFPQSAYTWHRHPLGNEYTEIYQK